jgi:hypothetical protein
MARSRYFLMGLSIIGLGLLMGGCMTLMGKCGTLAYALDLDQCHTDTAMDELARSRAWQEMSTNLFSLGAALRQMNTPPPAPQVIIIQPQAPAAPVWFGPHQIRP